MMINIVNKRNVLIGIMIVTLLSIACFIVGCDNKAPEDEELNISNEEQVEENKELTFESTFTYQDIEFTIGRESDVDFYTIEAKSSPYNGQKMVKVPVKITNKSEEKQKFNINWCSFFDSNGIQYNYIGGSFNGNSSDIMADDISKVGTMRTTATANTFFYLNYTGSGDYYIDFGSGTKTELEVKLPIRESNNSETIS